MTHCNVSIINDLNNHSIRSTNICFAPFTIPIEITCFLVSMNKVFICRSYFHITGRRYWFNDMLGNNNKSAGGAQLMKILIRGLGLLMYELRKNNNLFLIEMTINRSFYWKKLYVNICTE